MTRERVLEELRRVAITTIYLYVCFGAVLLYRTAVLRAHGIELAPWGLALIKALVLAKFILIGRAVGYGERYAHKPLIYYVLYKSVLFVVMLVALSLAEEIIKGFFHDETMLQSLSDFGGWLQILAVTLLLWLIMLPYLGIIRLAEVMGEGRLRQMVWGH